MEDTISVRIPKEELQDVEDISKINNMTKAVILREVLKIGIKNKMIEIAVDKFQKKQATLSKAAEIAKVPITQFLDILHDKNINLHYNVKDFREDLEGLI